MSDESDDKDEDAGKWFSSTNDEHFSLGEGCDTREGAVELALDDMDLEDGQVFYTARAERITSAELLTFVPDRVVELINEYLYDNIGGDHEFEVADDAIVEMRAMLIAWVDKHGKGSPKYRMEDTESHIYEQCKETRLDSKMGRCIRPIEHEGECDFV